MREHFDEIAGQSETNPMESARRSSRAVQRKRFYTDVGVGEADGGYTVTLDGKPIKTPSGSMVVAPSRPLAEMIAAEWNAQGEFIEPLTMPLTAGPGTISVAISLGAGRPSGFHAASLAFFIETLAAVALIALLVYGFYRNSARITNLIGATGTTIVVRLSAFLLFCIGIQVFWNGAAELLGTLPLGAAGVS